MSGNNTYLAAATPCLLECFIPYRCNTTLPDNLQPNTTLLPLLSTFNPIPSYQGSLCHPKKFQGCKFASDPARLEDIDNRTSFSNSTIIFMKSKVNCTMVIFECKSICIPEQTNTTYTTNYTTNHTNSTTEPARRLLEQEIKTDDSDEDTDADTDGDSAYNTDTNDESKDEQDAQFNNRGTNEHKEHEQKDSEANTLAEYLQDAQGKQSKQETVSADYDQSSASSNHPSDLSPGLPSDLLGNDAGQMSDMHR